MKIIGICGSPRNKSNTALALDIAMKEAEKEDIETEMIFLSEKEIKQCTHCNICVEKQCPVDDDVEEILQKMVEADGIIIATPTYFADISGLLKDLIDRTLPLRRQGMKLKNKIGGAIAVGASRNGGQEHACMTIIRFMLLHEMIIVSDQKTAHFGGIGIGSSKNQDAILNDETGIQTIKNIGIRVAKLVKYGVKN